SQAQGSEQAEAGDDPGTPVAGEEQQVGDESQAQDGEQADAGDDPGAPISGEEQQAGDESQQAGDPAVSEPEVSPEAEPAEHRGPLVLGELKARMGALEDTNRAVDDLVAVKSGEA